jgi:hypothetical protein
MRSGMYLSIYKVMLALISNMGRIKLPLLRIGCKTLICVAYYLRRAKIQFCQKCGRDRMLGQ